MHRASHDIAIDTVAGWLVHGAERVRKLFQELLLAEADGGVLCLEVLCDGFRESRFVISPFGEADENVCGMWPAERTRATRAVESIPPERKTPTGTSLTRCRAIDSRKRSAVFSRLAAGVSERAGVSKRSQ